MPLVSYGVNHQSAPLCVRERLAITPEQTVPAVRDLLNTGPVNEAVWLSTCNRTEIYADVGDPALFSTWLQRHCGLQPSDLEAVSYCHYGYSAIRHLLRVAVGLDSMVLGEPQILGQLKQAYALAQSEGSAGSRFKQLFPSVFAMTKKIRSSTEIGRNPVSMAYAVVQLTKRIFSDLPKLRVLLVGAGEMMELMATHLRQHNVKQLYVANRTLEKAEAMVTRFDARALRIADIPAYMPQVDLVVTATASQLPIIGKGLIESTLQVRKHRPLLMIDMAVPRDIEPQVGDLEDIYLFNMDDLQQMIAANLASREQKAEQAQAMVDIQAQHFLQTLRVMNAGDMIQRFRAQSERLRDEELAKALHRLQQGHDASVVVASLARGLTNKMLHLPTKRLRQAAYDEQVELLLSIKKLYGLE